MASQPSDIQKKKSAINIFAPVDREHVLLAFIAALVVMTLYYRNEDPAVYCGTAPVSDLLFIALSGLFYLGIKMALRGMLPGLAGSKIFVTVEIIIGALVLLSLTLIVRTHLELLITLKVGLTLTLVQLSPQMFSTGDFWRMMTWTDRIFVVTPLTVFFLSVACAKWLKQIYKAVGIVLILLALVSVYFPPYRALKPEFVQNPIVFLVEDAIRTEIFEHSSPQNEASRQARLSKAQQHSIRLIDPAFVFANDSSASPLNREPLTPDGKPWNILIFILESTGADYIFDTSQGNKTPMPFLQKMSREGLYLSNHFATANLSARAGFSIFTGLYPSTSRKTLCMDKDLSIPTLNRYLPLGYDYFFEHPTTPTYWFPHYLFVNNQLKELDTMGTLPAGHRVQPTKQALNELDCFNFLQLRLDHAHEPFLSAYWSYIPHYPYSDYGPNFRVLPDFSDPDRYYNDLHVLDMQLQRIFEHLVKTGVAERTLFVFIGDHGEALGQHQEWGHAFGPYSETYLVPAIFWQPKLIKPRIIKYPTSHVDIVPTILDLVGVPYNPARFQGHSVLRGIPSRKYIFTMDGYASFVSAISHDMKKVSIDFEKNDSVAFDLIKDPAEKHPLDVNKFPDEVQAIYKFRKFQMKMISDYNHAILNHANFPPPVSGGFSATN